MVVLGNFASAAAVLGAVLCAGGTMADDPPALADTAWTLSELPGRTLLPDRPVTMRFETDRVQGSDGCNAYSSMDTTESGGLRLTGGMVCTGKACPEPEMMQAEAFFRRAAS